MGTNGVEVMMAGQSPTARNVRAIAEDGISAI
jgi:hypothetical protein